MNTKERSLKIYKKEEYAYKNTSCIKSISINRPRNVKYMLLAINGIAIEPSSSTPSKWTWDFKIIREKIRDLFGETKHETNLIALESNFTYNSLKAIQHYTLSKDELKSSIFTTGLIVQFVPSTPSAEILEGNEIVYISDQQKEQQQKEQQPI
jgi:hypothetical protein